MATEVITEFLLAALSIFSSFVVVLILVFLGWYLVWKLFLSRFRFVRELLGSMHESPTNTASELKSTRAKKMARRD